VRHVLISTICLCAATVAPAHSQTPSSPSPRQAPQTATPPNKRADSVVPRDGVINPGADSTVDSTVRPPNVDPNITIPPPGTPGGDPRVIPK